MTRRTWTEETLLAELTAVVSELGHFPKKSDLEARGNGSLWGAMQRRGGVAAWRERLAAAPSPISTPAREPDCVEACAPADIAVAAYFLHESGHPGEPLDHWLAAERQLAAA